jgi:hypothetical protein
MKPTTVNRSEPRQRRVANFLAAGVVLAFGLLAGSGILSHAKQQDFLNLYTGARLAREGQYRQLHDPALQLERENELAGPRRTLVPFVRPHFYALALSPLARFPLDVAFGIWIALQGALLLTLLILVGRDMGSEGVLLAALFAGPLLGLLHGQDSALIALLSFLGYRSLARGQETRGGLWWSLLLVKFHLAIGPAVALLAARRWRAMASFLCGCLLLGAINLRLSGSEGAVLYARMLMNPSTEGLYPAPQKLACLQGLAANVPAWSVWIYSAAGLPVLVLILLAFRSGVWQRRYAPAQAGALYLTPHIYLYDWSILTPALLSSAQPSNPLRERGLSLFLLSPLGAVAFLATPYTQIVVHGAYLAWLATLALASRSGRHAEFMK